MSARLAKAIPQQPRPQEPARVPSEQDMQLWIAEAEIHALLRGRRAPG